MKKTVYSYDSSKDAKVDSYPSDGYPGHQKFYRYPTSDKYPTFTI